MNFKNSKNCMNSKEKNCQAFETPFYYNHTKKAYSPSGTS